MHDDTLKNRLQERFEGYESAPSDAVWEGIESALNEDEKRGAWFWWFSPLGLSILAGTSAAALALFFWVPSENPTAAFPTIDSIRSANSTMTLHEKVEQVQEETFVPTQNHTQKQNLTPTMSYSVALPNFRFELPPYQLVTGEEIITAAKLECVPAAVGDVILEDLRADTEKPRTHRRWELQMTASGFVRTESTSNSKPIDISDEANTYADASIPENLALRQHRFGEFEVSGIGYFSRKLKVGIGFSGAYSDQDGRINPKTQFATKQWTFGIPVQVGIDLLQTKRVELSVVTKFLNDWDFRENEILTEQETVVVSGGNNLIESTELTSSSVIEKGTSYRFGVQPTFVASFAIQPQLAISVGIGYRAYLAESRSKVNFDKSNYGTLTIGLVKRL